MESPLSAQTALAGQARIAISAPSRGAGVLEQTTHVRLLSTSVSPIPPQSSRGKSNGGGRASQESPASLSFGMLPKAAYIESFETAGLFRWPRYQCAAVSRIREKKIFKHSRVACPPRSSGSSNCCRPSRCYTEKKIHGWILHSRFYKI